MGLSLYHWRDQYPYAARRWRSLLDKPGYDEATGLLYVPHAHMHMPAIPMAPTKGDAISAYELLRDLLQGFPFEGPVDLAVAMVAIIGTVARGAYEVAPMILLTAPDVGTGKSFMVDLAQLHRPRPQLPGHHRCQKQ